MQHYLLTADQITKTLGASGCTSAGGSVIDSFAAALAMTLPRVEELMGVDSLVRGTFTDTFLVEDDYQRPRQLRLMNALLPDSTIETPFPITLSGNSSNFTGLSINRQYGIVTTPILSRGVYTCTYTSGLAFSEDGFLQDVPEWLSAIAINCILVWYRMGSLTIKIADGVSYSAMMDAVIRELKTRIYARYQRPRYGVIFADRLDDGS